MDIFLLVLVLTVQEYYAIVVLIAQFLTETSFRNGVLPLAVFPNDRVQVVINVALVLHVCF